MKFGNKNALPKDISWMQKKPIIWPVKLWFLNNFSSKIGVSIRLDLQINRAKANKAIKIGIAVAPNCPVPKLLKPTITTFRAGVFDNISAYLMPDIFAENFNLFNEGKLDAIVINSDFFTQIQGSAIETQITNESFAILFRKNNALIASQNSISLNDLKNKNRKSK